MPSIMRPVDVPFGQWVRLTEQEFADLGLGELGFQVTKGRVKIRRDSDAVPVQSTGWNCSQSDGPFRNTLDEISADPGGHVWAYGLHYPSSEVIVDYA